MVGFFNDPFLARMKLVCMQCNLFYGCGNWEGIEVFAEQWREARQIHAQVCTVGFFP